MTNGVRQRHQQRCEAGWDVVGHVVDACCPTAEVAIALGAIADHRVKGVDHLVGQHTGCAEHGKPEEGRYDAVAEVLGKRLEGSRTHFLCRELTGVASHDAGYLSAAFIQRTVEGEEDSSHLADEGGASKTVEDDEHTESLTPDPSPKGEGSSIFKQSRIESSCYQPSDTKDQDNTADGQHRALELLMPTMIKTMFPIANPLAKPHNGVRQARRVAQAEVEQPTE